MSVTYPIKNEKKLDQMKAYYLIQKPNLRNYALMVLGLNTAFRIGDLLELKWKDVYNERENDFEDHISLVEQKTGKIRMVAINASVKDALIRFKAENKAAPDTYLFPSRKNDQSHISRSQAFRIIKEAAKYVGLEEHISCHSLRKTFGYYAWKQGIPPAMLMAIYNHSSYRVTKQYLCIEQDDKDKVYLNIQL